MADDSNQVQKINLDKVDWKSSREFFESLGEELDKLENKDEAYDFTWVGKRKAIIEAGAPINKTLRPNVEESKDWETTENLFIEGDNLDALKLLQESYLGKVKMIYIDPPYNTGKDFVYHDNFKATTEDYDEDTEYKDEKGNIQFKKNEKTNGRYHSDWLSMIYPRIKLARNLLSDDGVIFISIDDNEQANLKKLCDEVFGEDNFIALFIVNVAPAGTQSSVLVAQQHDYCLLYRKSPNFKIKRKRLEEKDLLIKYPESDENGKYSVERLWKRGIGGKKEDVPTLHFPVYYNDHTGEIFIDNEIENVDGLVKIIPYQTAGVLGRWTWSKSKMMNEKHKLIVKKVAGEYKLHKKRYQTEDEGVLPKSIIDSSIARTELGSIEIKDLMGGKVFDYPKSSSFISYLINFSTDNNSIVIDFFSGSATTANATMQLNAEDGGNRKWIMVQLPEETAKNSEAFKAGYKTIPEISRKRIRRAGEKVKEDYKDELARREMPLDVGFRTLTVADTNYGEVFKPVGQQTQESLLDTIDNVKEDRSELDLLYGVLVQSALELNRSIEKKNISGADVCLYDYFGEVSGLAACFAESVPEGTIKEIAKLKPLTAVFKDSSFESSQDKVNLAEHFRIISPDTKVKVI